MGQLWSWLDPVFVHLSLNAFPRSAPVYLVDPIRGVPRAASLSMLLHERCASWDAEWVTNAFHLSFPIQCLMFWCLRRSRCELQFDALGSAWIRIPASKHGAAQAPRRNPLNYSKHAIRPGVADAMFSHSSNERSSGFHHLFMSSYRIRTSFNANRKPEESNPMSSKKQEVM